ncbi:hypothetical protein HI914_05958 [Erysiphe necator]|nr:hypothetical protein HI914_05958 [Erysiphe necator]
MLQSDTELEIRSALENRGLYIDPDASLFDIKNNPFKSWPEDIEKTDECKRAEAIRAEQKALMQIALDHNDNDVFFDDSYYQEPANDISDNEIDEQDQLNNSYFIDSNINPKNLFFSSTAVLFML